MKLLDVQADYLALDELLDQTGGEITEENEAAFEALFKEIVGNAAEKLDGYCNLIASLERRSAALKEREEIFSMDRKVTDRKADSLRERMKIFGITTGLLTLSQKVEGKKTPVPGRKIETLPSGYKIGIQTAGKAALYVDETMDIPDEYLTYLPPVVNKEAIRAALDAGQTLPFAAYKEKSISLTIK